MRYLRLYPNDASFKADEINAGGTGNDVEAMVPGIVKTADLKKMYFNPHDKTVQFHTLTIYYEKSNGEQLAECKTMRIKYLSGVAQELILYPKVIDGYVAEEEKIIANIPEDTSIVFYYKVKLDYKKPLTFNIISSGTIYWKSQGSIYGNSVEYKKNDNEWTTITSTTAGLPINVTTGDIIQFRGNNATYATSTLYYNFFSGSTAKFELDGNIMSLIDSENFSTATTLVSSYTFYNLFNQCTGLMSAENLILPATTLASSCYWGMFRGCTSLTKSPALPATTLASSCYRYMFGGCTSLTSAPELPATTLVNYCYYQMFQGCTSLTTAPELPATTLAESCYNNMFSNCTNLNYIKCLATDISAIDCTNYWVNGVASTGTFVKNVKMTDWTSGTNGIPYSWTVEDFGPVIEKCLTFNVLSSGTISWNSSNSTINKTIQYKKNNGNWTNITSSVNGASITVSSGDIILFRGDNEQYAHSSDEYTSFRSSNALFEVEGNIMSLVNSTGYSDISVLSSAFTFSRLFYYCTGITSAAKLILPATSLTDYCYEYMFGWCSNLVSGPNNMPAMSLTPYCYREMFRYCTSLTTAPELPATTLAESCYRTMFHNCTGLTSAPELPAGTLVDYCYAWMFQDCRNLNYIKCLATNISGVYCVENWAYNVSSSGTFVKNKNMNDWGSGPRGIPENWTIEDNI